MGLLPDVSLFWSLLSRYVVIVLGAYSHGMWSLVWSLLSRYVVVVVGPIITVCGCYFGSLLSRYVVVVLGPTITVSGRYFGILISRYVVVVLGPTITVCGRYFGSLLSRYVVVVLGPTITVCGHCFRSLLTRYVVVVLGPTITVCGRCFGAYYHGMWSLFLGAYYHGMSSLFWGLLSRVCGRCFWSILWQYVIISTWIFSMRSQSQWNALDWSRTNTCLRSFFSRLTAAVLENEVGEPPDIAEPDSVAYARENELELAAPRPSLLRRRLGLRVRPRLRHLRRSRLTDSRRFALGQVNQNVHTCRYDGGGHGDCDW